MNNSNEKKTFNYAIFASGTGSNALALIKAGSENNCLPKFILSNRADCTLLKNVPQSIPTYVVESSGPQANADYDLEVLKYCKEYDLSWVFLAGFMKILSSEFLNYFKESNYCKVINIHPSLLPKYKGLNAYERSFKAQDSHYGHTLHLVDEKIDHGAVLSQRIITRNLEDTIEDYKKRGLRYENEDYACFLTNMINIGASYVESCRLNPIIKEDMK